MAETGTLSGTVTVNPSNEGAVTITVTSPDGTTLGTTTITLDSNGTGAYTIPDLPTGQCVITFLTDSWTYAGTYELATGGNGAIPLPTGAVIPLPAGAVIPPDMPTEENPTAGTTHVVVDVTGYFD